jgi:sugar phosphate permease
MEDKGMSASSTEKPSRVRWEILLLLCLIYLITFMDRTNISVAAPEIAKEFGFDKTTMGFVFSAFVWAYALGQVPGGWLGDRFGPRLVLSLIVAYWSIMTGVTALAAGFISFMIIRFLFGLGEAGAFPTATRAMQLWYPPTERGLAQGLTHSFSRFGIAIVPPISAAIMLAFGWRWIFYIFGVVGVLWSIAFYIIYRNSPEEHTKVNRAELAHIRGVDEHGQIIDPIKRKDRPKLSWKRLLGSSNMWYIIIGWMCYNYCIYFFVTWLPTYLTEYRHFSLREMGLLASLPLFAGVIGDTVGGIISDRIYTKTRNLKLARRVVAAPAFLLTAAFLIPAASTDNPYHALYYLAGALFFLECVIGPAWAMPLDVGGQYSGTVSGLMNMGGNLAGSLSPIVFGYLVQHESWVAPLYLQAGICVIGAIVWTLLINPEKSVVDELSTQASLQPTKPVAV